MKPQQTEQVKVNGKYLDVPLFGKPVYTGHLPPITTMEYFGEVGKWAKSGLGKSTEYRERLVSDLGLIIPENMEIVPVEFRWKERRYVR